jgi:hypothetical protein
VANRLREAVKNELYPFLSARGFVRVKSQHSQFAFFTKPAAVQTLVLFFQWDKYGRESFVINLSKLPVGSEVKSLGPFDVEWMARLQPSASSPRWWKTRKPLLAALMSLRFRSDPCDVVKQVMDAFNQAELWWERGHVGDHIRALTDLPPNRSLERTREG